MPPKKKKEEAEDLGAMKAARFGRVKNDLAMGFVGEFGLVPERVNLRGGCARVKNIYKSNALLLLHCCTYYFVGYIIIPRNCFFPP